MEEKKRVCENCIFFGCLKEQGVCYHNLPQFLVVPTKLGTPSIQFFDLAVMPDRPGCEHWRTE